MDGFESFEEFPEDVGDDAFIYALAVVADEVVERSVLHVLNEHEEGVLVIVGEVVSDYVLALADCHNCDFLFELLKVFLIFEGDDAYCEYFIFVLMRTGLINLAHAALPDLVQKLVLKSWLLKSKPDLL
jgi:hypothetical protein